MLIDVEQLILFNWFTDDVGKLQYINFRYKEEFQFKNLNKFFYKFPVNQNSRFLYIFMYL